MLMSSEGKGGAGEDGGGEERVKVQETNFSPHPHTYVHTPHHPTNLPI